MSMADKHKKLERNITLLAVCTFIAVAIGGIVQITPLFYLENTIEKVDGMRPYTPLEQAGRDIYVREGCYTCHYRTSRGSTSKSGCIICGVVSRPSHTVGCTHTCTRSSNIV